MSDNTAELGRVPEGHVGARHRTDAHPHHRRPAMAFPDTYQWSGNRREQFRLSGNAVTPPAARDIVSTIAETLAA